MDTPSSIPIRSGIPRPASRLPVLRPSSSQSQLQHASSTEQLRKKPSVSSLSHTPSTEQLRKKPSVSSLSRPPSLLQKKPSRTSLARAHTPSTIPSTSSYTTSNRPSLTSATKRAVPTNAQRRASNSSEAGASRKPIGRPPSRQTRVNPQPAAVQSTNQDEDVLGDLDAFRSASRASSRVGFRENEPEHILESEPEPATPAPRKARLSLSDRTTESLSHLSSSPAVGKGRRRSSFFNADHDGMPPPLRPASALGNDGRPMTSDGTPQARPTTPRRFGSLAQRGSMTAPGKRSVSAAIPDKLSASTPSKPLSVVKKLPLSHVENVAATPRLRPLSSSKTMIARAPKSRPSLAGVFGQVKSPTATTTATPLTPPPSKKTAMGNGTPASGLKSSKSSSALREHIAKTKASRRSDVVPKVLETPSKLPSSSSALRDQIAKAKEAARRATPAKTFGNGTPPKEIPAVKEGDFALVPDPIELATFDFGLDDPFNQLSKGGKSHLRKRVDAARMNGRLNIAAMGLSEIPIDVLNMYKYDPNDDSVAWGEIVDLNTILAADNNLQSISDEVFPDIDVESTIDSEDSGPQFGSVQNLDFHGNVLRDLPIGLRRLTQLSKLNLSRNQLPMSAFSIISQITTLRELKLADNDLKGDLPGSLADLSRLEVLEVQSNKLTSLPAEIRQLIHLRILNISENQIKTLPSELFSSVPIIELIAVKNTFSGSFFNVDTVPHLQKLVLSNNSITSLCESGTILLPALKYLDLGVNRLSSLPDMTCWTSLTTLLIGDNKLSSLPNGFVSLQQSLQHADFTGNDITNVDEKIALMDGLQILVLAANPLRVRKYLTMNTSDLKRDLHSRLEPEAVEVAPENEAEVMTESDAKTSWQLKPSGILDLSDQNMSQLDGDALESFAQSNEVRQISLQQNALTSIPVILSQFDHLSILDLSRNNITRILTESLRLPKLRELRLLKNKLQTLDDIMVFLSAPSLQQLDISINLISGPLPTFRDVFPELLILQASDNKISDVSAASLNGLKIVNLSNNEIPRLEPHIGLLAGTLTSLSVDGNTFRVPNYALLSKGTEAVLTWLRGRIPSSTEEFSPGPGTPDL